VTPSSMSSSQPSLYSIYLRLYIAPTFTERKQFIETILHTYDAAKYMTELAVRNCSELARLTASFWRRIINYARKLV
jgi:hypothetical protein